jgi:hypothetical protein
MHDGAKVAKTMLEALPGMRECFTEKSFAFKTMAAFHPNDGMP